MHQVACALTVFFVASSPAFAADAPDAFSGAALITSTGESFGSDSVAPPPGGVIGGACCLVDQCVFAPDEATCNAFNGFFFPEEDCADGPCDEGACCFDDSCGQLGAYACISSGRVFAGAGTSCLDDPCDADIGACCFDDDCLDLSPDDCGLAGGVWLGAGTFCSTDPCASGACCLDEETCIEVIQLECFGMGGTLIAGAACADDPCAPPDPCPEGTLFSQAFDDPNDFIGLTSEESADLRRFEDFSGVAGPIDEITFWGFDLEFVGGTFIECAETDTTFEITFYEDAGGFPGALACSYTLAVTRTPLGMFYLGAELNEYTVALPTDCVLVNGWISIVGLGDPDCWFLWLSAGSGRSLCDNCIATEEDFDLSLCLQGTVGGVLGACCDDTTATCNDDVDISDCTAAGLRFAPEQMCADLDPECGIVLGACCFGDATCTIEEEPDCATLGGSWLGANTLCDQCPCITPCPPGGIAEGEPLCDDGYVDEFNGGCAAAMELFSPIAIGDTICGESGVFDGGDSADFDWYQIEITQTLELQWTVVGEFRPAAFIVDGTNGCPGVQLAGAAAFECETVTVSALLGPGTHWFVGRPNAFTDSSVCGARYTATLEVICSADFDGSGDVATPDLLMMLGQWGPCVSTCSADLDGSGDVATTDLLALLAAWGPCPVVK